MPADQTRRTTGACVREVADRGAPTSATVSPRQGYTEGEHLPLQVRSIWGREPFSNVPITAFHHYFVSAIVRSRGFRPEHSEPVSKHGNDGQSGGLLLL